MQFEQFQEEDGKNVINITVEKNDSEKLKTDAEIFMHKKDTDLLQIKINQEKKVENVGTEETKNNSQELDKKYERYQYMILGGIILTLIFLITIIILYIKGF
jgi:hypothetical protein